jgi:hypothetical protein
MHLCSAQEAERLKVEGNRMFKAARYVEALELCAPGHPRTPALSRLPRCLVLPAPHSSCIFGARPNLPLSLWQVPQGERG